MAKKKPPEKFPHRVDEYPCPEPGCDEAFLTLQELGTHRSEVHFQAPPFPEGVGFRMEDESEVDTPKE